MPLRYFISAISGVLYCLAFVGFEQWWLAWVCFVPFLFALEGVSPKQGFLMGWLFGVVALTGGFYWVAYTIHVFAYMPWVASGIGCVLLSIFQGFEFALFGLLYAWARKRSGIGALILAPVVFVAAEFVSPQLFPHYFGASQYLRLPVIQMCDITGVQGVSLLLVFVNACIYVVATTKKWKPAVLAFVAVAISLAYGYYRSADIESEMASAKKVRFGIAQVNLGIREKERDPKKAIALSQEQTRLLKAQGAEIVVWPETAIREPILSKHSTKLADVVFDALDIPIITGTLQRDMTIDGTKAYNVAVLTDAGGNILGSYKKQILLAFGEHIPFGRTFPELYKWFPYISNFTAGDSNEPLKFGDHSFSINICYEEILPRLMRKMALYSPDVFINLTNDNWFGNTHEPLQHFALSIFRSVEHRRWLVRSTNTGISAFVDATGRIVERSPVMEPAMLIQDVAMMSKDTIYTKFGDWLGWVCVGLTMVFSFKKTRV